MGRGLSANATPIVKELDTERIVMSKPALEMLRSEQDAFLSAMWVDSRTVFTTTLTITGTVETNSTKVACALAVYDLTDLVFDQSVYLHILSKELHVLSNKFILLIFNLGPPTKPLDLIVSTQEDDTILFSWSPSFSSYSVPVTYQVQVQNEDRVLQQSTTNSTWLLYDAHDDHCSILTFRTRASNRAGRTNESVLTYSMLTSNG